MLLFWTFNLWDVFPYLKPNGRFYSAPLTYRTFFHILNPTDVFIPHLKRAGRFYSAPLTYRTFFHILNPTDVFIPHLKPAGRFYSAPLTKTAFSWDSRVFKLSLEDILFLIITNKILNERTFFDPYSLTNRPLEISGHTARISTKQRVYS